MEADTSLAAGFPLLLIANLSQCQKLHGCGEFSGLEIIPAGADKLCNSLLTKPHNTTR